MLTHLRVLHRKRSYVCSACCIQSYFPCNCSHTPALNALLEECKEHPCVTEEIYTYDTWLKDNNTEEQEERWMNSAELVFCDIWMLRCMHTVAQWLDWRNGWRQLIRPAPTGAPAASWISRYYALRSESVMLLRLCFSNREDRNCSKKNAQITNFRWRINLMSLHVFSFLNGPLVYASKFPSLPNWKRRLESNGAISRIPKGKKLLSESFHALQTTILTIDPALQQYLNLSLWSPLCW